MKKVLILIIIILLIVMCYNTIKDGYEIGELKILSIGQIKQENTLTSLDTVTIDTPIKDKS